MRQMEQLSQQRKLTIMAAIITAMFFSSISQTIVGVALPRIIAQLGGMEYYTWVITIYLLTSTISTILVGKLSDIYGRKPFILAGILIFMVGAFLTGTAGDILRLILYRGIQGLGAGIILATAFTAIGDLFSPRERGRWSGLMSAVFGLSSVLGPGLGGYIVEHLAWRWVFWLFLPLGLVAFLMILLLFPRAQRQAAQSIDYAGSLLLTLTIVSLLLAFSWAGSKYAWSSPTVLGLLSVTVTALVLFLWVEGRVKTPVLPLGLFRSSVISLSNLISFLMHMAMMGALTYMPFYVQGVMGITPTYAGYITMPMSVGMFTLSAYAGRTMTKTGRYKHLALIGLTAMVAGMSLMVVMRGTPAAVLSMIIFGAGLGLGMPVFMLAVQNAAPSGDLGVATASVQLFRNLGGTIGVAVMGTVLSANLARGLNGLIAGEGGAAGANLAPELFETLTGRLSPQLLLDHSRLLAVQEGLPPAAQPVFAHLAELLRQALAGSLSTVFLMGTAVLVLAFVLACFVKELPLRTTVRRESGSGTEQRQEPLPGGGALTQQN